MKKEKGITLQALAITIVIMAILAGIVAASSTDSSKRIINAKNKKENEFGNNLNSTENKINDIDSSWKNVINKNGIDKGLVYNESTKELTRDE